MHRLEQIHQFSPRAEQTLIAEGLCRRQEGNRVCCFSGHRSSHPIDYLELRETFRRATLCSETGDVLSVLRKGGSIAGLATLRVMLWCACSLTVMK